MLLAGGTGSSKLIRGLRPFLEDFAVIANVGDNQVRSFLGLDAVHAGATPEPASLVLFGLGALGLLACTRRRKKSTPADAPAFDAPA